MGIFRYNSKNKKSMCEVVGDAAGPSKDVYPHPEVPGKYPTNLKGHLKKYHRAQYEEALEKRKWPKKLQLLKLRRKL